MKEYKLGIVGFGGMAGWHNELIQSIDRLLVAGVYDIDENSVKVNIDNMPEGAELVRFDIMAKCLCADCKAKIKNN